MSITMEAEVLPVTVVTEERHLSIRIARLAYGKHETTHIKTDGVESWMKFHEQTACPFCIAIAVPMFEDKHDTLSLAHFIAKMVEIVSKEDARV